MKAPENTDILEFFYQEINIQLKNLTTILPKQYSKNITCIISTHYTYSNV